MFGDIQSDNEDDFVMPAFGDEGPAYNDSPDQVEADEADAFDEANEVLNQFEPVVPVVVDDWEDEEDVDMDEEPVAGESP